jgi:hypothetical protein
MGTPAGASLDDIQGVWDVGGDGAVHTVINGGKIQVVTGTTNYAGTRHGIDIVPEEFGGLQVGDRIEVMIQLVSIQHPSMRQAINNGFRIESSIGREAPAPGMQPIPLQADNSGNIVGHLIQPGTAGLTKDVIR